MEPNNREFILVNKTNKANNVVSLYFRTADSLPFSFKSGQYVNVRPASVSGHGKSYTISSSPSDKLVCLTVKRIGVISSVLTDLNIGEHIVFDGPYGFFYPEEMINNSGIVMLAGGIGITPFYSIISDRINNKIPVNTTLFYSNKTRKDITFFDELISLVKKDQSLVVVNCLTQEKVDNSLMVEYSRIDKKILKKHLNIFDQKDYFICGSISFVNDLWKLLKECGVLEERIFTESFF